MQMQPIQQHSPVKLPNGSTLNSDAAILARFPLGTYFQAGDEIMRRSSVTAPATGGKLVLFDLYLALHNKII